MVPTLRHQNGTLAIDQSQIASGSVVDTILTADIAAASGTITVKNITGFAINQVLLIGELGTEGAEIILTHASSAPSGTTVTLASNTVRAHSAGTKVYVILYNQFELSHATTATGSKTVLTVATTANANPPSGLGSGLIAIDPTTRVQTIETSEHSSGFYFARYKNSITSDFSGYTDAIEYGGWEAETVGYMIDQALRQNKTTLSSIVTRHDCYRWINEAIRFIQGKQLRYPQHQNLNAILGQTVRGTFSFTLPTDIYENDTNQSVIGVRIDETSLTYLDPKEFEDALNDTKYTQVRTQASANDTSLDLDNSYDFADSGSVNVYISGTKYNITYTGVTRDDATGATAALTGIPASGTGSITVTIPVDTYVWQDEVEGKPVNYTVRNGALDITPLPDATYDNKNITLDYFTFATEVDSDGDEIDVQRFDMLLDYLTWRIRMMIKNDGALDQNDGYYAMFKEKLNDAIRNSRSVFKHKMAPKINRIKYRG